MPDFRKLAEQPLKCCHSVNSKMYVIAELALYIFIHRLGRKNINANIQQEKIEKKHKNTNLTSNQIIKQLRNNVNHM